MRRICLALLLLMFFVLPASALDFVTETVDEGSMQGKGTSLALDSNGNPHMSFIAEGDSSLQYAYYDGSEWNVTPVFTEGDVDYEQTCIVLGEDDIPHIVAHQKGYPNYSLIYATQNGTDWDVKSFDLYGRYPSLALDQQGYPHIVSINQDDDSDTVEYSWYDGNDGWQQYPISNDYFTGDDFRNGTSIAMDESGLPHVSLYNNYKLWYAHFDGEMWTVESVDQEGEVGQYSSIALDENGTPHISYYDSSNGDLKYAFLSGDEWETYTLDSDDSVGEHSSIQVDSDGYVHISYYDSSNNDLKYALYNGNEWSFKTVDSQDDVGKYTSLALDASGNPAISYYDKTNDDAKYASFDGENWTVQAVSPSGLPTGSYPEIALDSDENPHMIYTAQNNYSGGDDDDADSIFYAYHDGTEWQKQVIVSEDYALEDRFSLSQSMSNSDVNLAMDDNDIPHVSYIDGSVIQYGVGNSWTFETVSSDLGILRANNLSLAVEGNGTPHISFVDSPFIEYSGLGSSSSYSLWHAVKSGDLWATTSVDEEGDFGMNTIAVDSDGLPHICYFKKSSISNETFSANDNVYELKYAVLSGDNWLTQTVSSDLYGYSYELYCDLAVDSYGIPHIAFVKPSENLDVESMATSLSRYESYELFYATLVDEEWNTVLVDTLGYFRDGKISIQVDSYDNPHITYGLNERADLIIKETATQTGESELKYAYYDGSSWYTETLATGTMSGFGLQSSLALTSTNIPHIAYFTGTGVNYMTVPQEEAELIASSGDGCNLAIFSPAMALLVLPLLGLFRNRK